MPFPAFSPQPLRVERAPWLRGNLSVPGDLMASQLTMAVAALALGETMLTGAPPAAALQGLAAALRELGVIVSEAAAGWQVHGLGVGGLLEPRAPLDFRDNPLGLQLAMGLAGGLDFTTTFKGDSRYSREGEAFVDRLGQLGIHVAEGQAGRLPLSLRGPALMLPADLTLPAGQPGQRAGLILGALNARGTLRFTQALPAEGQAERLLGLFGANVRPGADATLEIDGLPRLGGRTLTIPGDPALAAMVAVAAAIVPGSQVVIETVLLDPARTAVLSALVAMGAGITIHNAREVSGERVGDIVVRQQPLRANTFAERFMTLLAGNLPLLAAAAAVAEGDTSFVLPAELALLHRGRLTDLAAMLRELGVEALAAEDAFHVRGGAVRGGQLVRGADAGIGFAALALGMVAEEEVTIGDRAGIEELFPGFVPHLERIGASFVHPAEGP
jgi:3-phosphoshikimate 1-carboxyvinyltransferase